MVVDDRWSRRSPTHIPIGGIDHEKPCITGHLDITTTLPGFHTDGGYCRRLRRFVGVLSHSPQYIRSSSPFRFRRRGCTKRDLHVRCGWHSKSDQRGSSSQWRADNYYVGGHPMRSRLQPREVVNGVDLGTSLDRWHMAGHPRSHDGLLGNTHARFSDLHAQRADTGRENGQYTSLRRPAPDRRRRPDCSDQKLTCGNRGTKRRQLP